jgi:hypothetical protein
LARYQTLRLTGVEKQPISVEDYANFMRDLVFIHDRVYILASKEGNYRLYHSNWFYVRDQPRIPNDQMLLLHSASIGSPFTLKIDINVDEWFKAAADAFLKILYGVITIPEHRERERLQNRLIKAKVLEAEHQQRARSAVLKIERKKALQELQKLPGLAGRDREGRQHLLQRDIDRISESPLLITDIEMEGEKKRNK